MRAASARTLRLGALEIDAGASSDALWVIDGQQRITSLANALHPDGQADKRFALSYNLLSNEFVRTPQIPDSTIIPLPVLFDLQKILRWFASHPDISEHLDQATSITRKIRQFEVPAYQVTEDDPGVLQEIFDRMNNYGKRLSRAEIFWALNAGDEEGERQSSAPDRIANDIDTDFSFGVIDNNTVLGAILAPRGADVTRDVRREFNKADDEGRDAAFDAGEQALRLAVSFLQQDAGVPHISMLAYRYLLPVLARVFAYHPDPDPRNRQLLRRWYWRAAMAGPERFKGGTANAPRILCAKVSKDDLSSSVQGLLSAVGPREHWLPDLSRFSTNEAATKMVLCAWWAAQPRSPETGKPYEQGALAECLVDQPTAREAVRYLVPQRAVPTEYRQSAAIRVLMPVLNVDANEVTSLLTHESADLDGDTWRAMLRSHAIESDMTAMLVNADYARFVEMRQEVLEQNLQDFLDRMCEREFEDTPPLSEFVAGDEDENVAD